MPWSEDIKDPIETNTIQFPIPSAVTQPDQYTPPAQHQDPTGITMDNQTREIVILVSILGGVTTACAVLILCYEYWSKHHTDHNRWEHMYRNLISPTYAGALHHEQEDDAHSYDSNTSHSSSQRR